MAEVIDSNCDGVATIYDNKTNSFSFSFLMHDAAYERVCAVLTAVPAYVLCLITVRR